MNITCKFLVPTMCQKIIFLVNVPANRIRRKLHIGKSPHIDKGNLLPIDNHPVCNAPPKHFYTASRLKEDLVLGKKGIIADAKKYNFCVDKFQEKK